MNNASSLNARLEVSGSTSEFLLRLHTATDGNLLLVSGSGDIGIGVKSLTARLHIKGSGNTSLTKGLQIVNSSNSPVLTAFDNGDIGIGTDSPESRVHIYNANGSAFYRAQDPFGSMYVGASSGFALLSSQAMPVVIKSDNENVQLWTNSIPRLYISNTGEVGIATSTPTSTLHSVGSFLNELTPTSLKIQSDLSSSFGVGSTYINGIGWTPLVISGSTTSFRTDGNRFKLNGITQGNLGIPALGASFPLEANIQLFATGSDYVSIGTQFTDLSGIGGNSTLNANQNGVFSGSYGNNSYTISIGKTYGSDESSLEIQKRNNAGETIALNLNSGNDGFSIFSGLSQPTSSFLRIISGSTNLIDFRYDANYIQRPTIIGSDSSTFPSARLLVKGAGTTSGTETLRITDNNDSPIIVAQDGGNVGIGTTPNSSFKLHLSGSSPLQFGGTTIGKTGLMSLQHGTMDAGEYSALGGVYFENSDSSKYQNDIVFKTTTPLSALPFGGSSDIFLWERFRIGRNSIQINNDPSIPGDEGSTTRLNFDSSPNSIEFCAATTLMKFFVYDFSGTNPLLTLSGFNNTAAFNTSPGAQVLKIRGRGATSATSALLVENSSTLPLLFVRDDGNVGIGTTSPSAELHISGASADTLFRVGSPASSSILFVNGSGRVGFGTDTPTQRIDVDGNILLRLGESAASGRLYLRDTITYLYEGSGLNLVSGPTRNIKLNAGNADRLFVSASGLVGIGTNTPLVALDVRGAAIFTNPAGVNYDENIRLPQSTAGYAGIALGGSIAAVGTSATQWTILKYPAVSSNVFTIRNNATDYLSITTTGNVGLGSNFITPTARLQVRGSGATSATTTFLLQNNTPTNLMTVLDNGQTTFSSPTISLATSQSAFTISQSISASNAVGGQYYGVNITPTFFATTASQTETALRVAATFTGSTAAVGGQNIIADFGATSAGSQFTVTDVTSGSIYMVNDVSGLPIIEATSNWDVNMYNFPNKVFEKTGNRVNIYGTLNATGSFVLPLSQSASPTVGTAYWSGSYLFVYDGTQYRSASFA
jgi:hypothetical protein